jgi:hypothetical protein
MIGQYLSITSENATMFILSIYGHLLMNLLSPPRVTLASVSFSRPYGTPLALTLLSPNEGLEAT